MNLVCTAAIPLTKTYRTEQRFETVQVTDAEGRPETVNLQGRVVIATKDEPIDVRVVDENLNDDAQREREAHVIAVLSAAFKELGALDARLSTRFHGTVDLTTWEG